MVAWFAGEVAVAQIRQGSLTSTANQIPRWWLTVSLLVGVGLSAVNFLVFAAETPQPITSHAE
jgi:TRAP-type C4-dicarboxylate transport system permease small subunit